MPVMYSSGGSSASLYRLLAPNPATVLAAKAGNKQVQLTWTDPEDREEWPLTAKWGYSVLIRKQGSAPTSVSDGTKVVESSVKNQYQTTAYVDTEVENDIEYFYAVYTYSTDGEISSSAPVASTTPRAARVMTVVIDLNDSNPGTCGSYADDAKGMLSGKDKDAISMWQEFFGYKPCLFKDGAVVGYLDPDDYTKFENGESADITSGDSGDVMVEFPRRGVKISKSEKIITVSMTDMRDDPDFTYYAHTRGSDPKNYFYLGAYLSYGQSQSETEILRSRSLSGKNASHICTIDECRECAHMNGSNYEQMTWYQMIYLQVMYILQFGGSLNSQSVVGNGYERNQDHKTGTLNTKGLVYGSTAKNQYVKLFGLEDLWGSNRTFLDGCYVDGINHVHTATDTFDDHGDDVDHGIIIDLSPGSDESSFGSVNDVVGSSELGFFPIAFDGSTSTYFCDDSAYNSRLAVCASGSWMVSGNTLGIFAINCMLDSSSIEASRLSYY